MNGWDFDLVAPHCFLVRSVTANIRAEDNLMIELKMRRTPIKNEPGANRHIYVVLNRTPAIMDCVSVNCGEVKGRHIALEMRFYGLRNGWTPDPRMSWIFEVDVDYNRPLGGSVTGLKPLRAYSALVKELARTRKTSVEFHNFVLEVVDRDHGGARDPVGYLPTPAMHYSNKHGKKRESWTLHASIAKPADHMGRYDGD